MGAGGAILPYPTKLRMPVNARSGVRPWGLSSTGQKGNSPRPQFKVPKSILSVEGGGLT